MKKSQSGKAIGLAKGVKYERGSIVSKTLLEKKNSDISLFAFDQGQGMSAHTSSYDAVVQVLDGEAALVIGRKPVKVKTGELVIMPARVPHSVSAKKRFKMLLTLVK